MRSAVFWLLLVGCGFEVPSGTHTIDAPKDSIDAPIPVTWAVDATSGKGVPTSTAQWNDFLRAHPAGTLKAPSHLWQLQETGGAISDSGSIGTAPLAPLNVAPANYQVAVTGWSRFALATDDTQVNQGFFTNAAGNLNGGSFVLLAYVAVSQPTAERSVIGIGQNSDHRYVALTQTPTFKAQGIGVTPVPGSSNPGSAVHPVVLAVNGTAGTVTVYTDQEKLVTAAVPTAGLGNLVILGNASIGAAPARYLYGALWTGPDATFSDASVKTLLTGLGWSVSGF